MSLAEIEAELSRLTPDELRDLALKSWSAFSAKESKSSDINECDEDDPVLLAALDDALGQAHASPGKGLSGSEVRAEIAKWEIESDCLLLRSLPG
jgi:hypothetical protein